MYTFKKLTWTENLRTLSTICVIMIHVCGPTISQFNDSPTWWLSNLLASFGRFCVPVFVMLTGALVLPKEDSISAHLKKRLSRILLPFIFWSFIYIAHDIAILIAKGNSINTVDLLKLVLIKFSKGSFFHLWYIYMIIGIYLFIPIIGKWARTASKKELIYFLTIWFISILFINVNEKYSPNINIMYFSKYIGYLVLGYFLSTTNYSLSIKQKLTIVFLFILGLGLTMIGTFAAVSNQVNPIFKLFGGDNFNLNVVLMSGCIFLLGKHVDINGNLLSRLRDIISSNSYGIYLSHMIVLIVLRRIELKFNLAHSSLFEIPLLIVATLITSSVLISFLRKVKGLSNITG